jgi:hypothetical protein
MPRGGTSYVVNVGESVKLDFDLCDGANWLRLRGPKGHRKTFGVTRVNSSTLTVVGKAVGTTWVNVRQANRDIKPMQLLSKPTRIEIVVRDPEASDPCAGKVPLGEWTDDADGGVLTAASTCEGQPLVFVIFRKKDEQLQYAMRFFSQEGQPTSGLGKLYGPGDYEVTMSHGYVEETPNDSRSVLLGERLTLEVNHQGAPETEGTISNGAITTERQGVVSMPPAVFSSVVDEGPEDPRNTGAAVPVAALPADATVMSCDASCLEGVVSRAGLETGAVEISIGDGEWTKVTARSSFVVPFEPTSVKMRVTPEEGQPVEMAAVFTRESVDAVYSAAENDSEEVEITDAVVGADGSTSFPWWIIAVIVALLALGGYAERRRRASKAASAN